MGTEQPDRPPLARVARGEVDGWPQGRMRSARSPAVVWTGAAWSPCWVTGWCRVYGEWFVRLRLRRDVWRDREDWYCYRAQALLPVELDQRDAQDWMPRR